MGAPSTFSRGLHVRCVIRTSTLCCSSRLSTDWDLLSLVSGTTFYCFVPFRGTTSPSLSVSTGLFFFKSRLGFKPRSMGICGGRRGTWDLRVAFDVDSLPLAAMSSLKLLLPLFSTMLSSSLFESSGRAITKFGVRIPEFLSDSPLTSEMLIKGALGIFSSSKEIFLSPPLVINEMRRPPLRVLL